MEQISDHEAASCAARAPEQLGAVATFCVFQDSFGKSCDLLVGIEDGRIRRTSLAGIPYQTCRSDAEGIALLDIPDPDLHRRRAWDEAMDIRGPRQA
ncbi:MAG TPA: hypothetical protein VLF59_04485 [Candidatus Saccharimonadales bacterium]|nr:hypothetical protein [Candidatus Saccharimonadales bacterium]